MIALDPGLDGTGVAVWGAGNLRRGAPASELARSIVELGLLESDPAGTIEQRCLEVVHQLRALLVQYAPAQVVIEVPSYTGVYVGKSGMADGLAKLNRLIGGLIVTAFEHAEGVEVIAPDTLPKAFRRLYGDVKQYRRAIVLEALAKGKRTQENTRGWGRLRQLANQDKIDAIYAGLRYLDARLELPVPR
ncbi:MAG TPA: hypothetical protein VFX29_00840 [Longimicrobiaceae bacterium]|nr:hypothetical protein [Longimicrobiaceae bacterium]